MKDFQFVRAEAARLSGWTLPKEAEERRRVIPPLTERQIRHLERYGLFDPYVLAWGRVRSKRRAGILADVRMPLVVRKPGRQGVPPIYSGLALASLRTAAWMWAEGCSYMQVVSVLIGSSARATIEHSIDANHLDHALVVSGVTSAVLPASYQPGRGEIAFPLAWLGISRASLPGIYREVAQQRKRAPLQMFGRPATIGDVAAYAQQAAAVVGTWTVDAGDITTCKFSRAGRRV